uniref:TFIIS N-terminal domain-containing protein n=1 Tax=Plectus sambesii TaxID=2011161 RepID=A0A914V6A9_9BILA
ATRIGAAVNDLRKRSQQPAPELSKRCRALIKLWQKVVERPPSSCGSSNSRGGTPRTPFTPASVASQAAALVSPAVRLLNKVTPPGGVRSQPVTPGAQPKPRVTSSTGSASKPTDNGPSNNVSPAWTSSYAPTLNAATGRLASPANGTKPAKSMPKSMSVGAELARKGLSPEGGIRLTIKVGSGTSSSTSTVVSTALASPSNAPPSVSTDPTEASMKLALKRKADYNQNESLV